MKIYILFQPNALWIGGHYSFYNKILCINIVPMITICIVFKNGVSPKKCIKK